MIPLRPALRGAIAAACLALGNAGCFVVTDSGSGGPSGPAVDPDPFTIDTGAVFDVVPGQGAGLWIEYLGDGAWDVYTSCDTAITDRPCDFDVILSAGPDAAVSMPELHDAEPVDSLELRSDGSFRMITGTALGLDGVTFTTDPGAPLTVDLLLDAQAQPSYLNWISDGAHVTGTESTSNPVIFIPAAP